MFFIVLCWNVFVNTSIQDQFCVNLLKQTSKEILLILGLASGWLVLLLHSEFIGVNDVIYLFKFNLISLVLNFVNLFFILLVSWTLILR